MYFINFYLIFVALVSPNLKLVYGEKAGIWCQAGDRKNYNPMQCEAETTNCFKFDCSGVEEPFTARGCGLSVLTKAAGLPNESCHQAQSVCEQLGGISNCYTCDNKHMCNSGFENRFLVSFLLIFAFLFCL